MALDRQQLENRIVNEMTSAGATATGEHSWVRRMARAIATAVVDEIQANAEVNVTSGSSAGTYGVE